jgi:hypothetical protein
MTKSPFAGREVHHQGGVLFIAAEGQNEVRVRLAGIVQAKATQLIEREGVVTIDPAHMPFVWIVSCPLLTSDTAGAELCKVIAGAKAEMLKRFGLPLVAVFIDTLMVAAGFDDADDSSEAQRVMSVLTTAAFKSELLVIAVDHFGKNASTGTRNSSVKEDAVEAVLAIIADKDLAGVVKSPRLAIRKQKASATGEQIPFEMRLVTIDEDTTTLVVDWGESGQGGDDHPNPEPNGKPWPASLVIFKRVLDNTLANVGRRMRPFSDGPEVLAAKRDSVRAEFLKSYPADSDKAKGMAFLRCEKLALAGGLMAMRTLGAEEEAATYFWRLGALF